jgi:uncharacterized protein
MAGVVGRKAEDRWQRTEGTGGDNRKVKRAAIWVLLGLVVATGGYGFLIEAGDVQVTHVTIRDDAFSILKGKTVVHITDLHMSEIGPREKKVLRMMEDLKADFVFLTGDFVKWGKGYEPALDFLAQVKASAGVFAVMGDYDYSNSRKSCLFCHEEGGGKPTRRHNVRFLRNQLEVMHFPEGDLGVLGVMDEDGDPSMVRKNLADWRRRGPIVALSHSPLNFDLLEDDQHALMLAGDTHGGQIPLPSWMWKILGYEKNAKYSEGLFSKGKKRMYVSRGVGTSHLPFRFMKRPEIAVLRFE